MHREKHPSQKNNIVFEMGEEGSKNAGIKPIRKRQKLICIIGERGWEYFAKLKQGLIEEKYEEAIYETSV